MSSYEYKTVALPRTVSGRRRRRQSEADLVAEQLGKVLNEEAVDSWEYLRAETLTTPGRSGMFQKQQPAAYVVLVFRRARALAWAQPEGRSAAPAAPVEKPAAPVRHATPPPVEDTPISPAPDVRPDARPPLQGGPDLRIASTSGQVVSKTEPILPERPGAATERPRAPLGSATD